MTIVLNKNDVPISPEEYTTIFTPGVSPALQQKIEDYAARQSGTLSFHAYSIERTGILDFFEFGGSIEPEEGYILLSIEAERFFDYPAAWEEGYERKAYWIDLVKKTFPCWHPLYVYEFDHSISVLQPTKDDVKALNVEAVYGVNFFGSEFVTKFGRERLQKAPAREIETFDDGGIFLYCPDQDERRAVAKHLNLIAANIDEEVNEE